MSNPLSASQYVDNLVSSASPARLRLMLIEKSVDVANCLAEAWRNGNAPGPNEHSIKLLDLLTELLSGVSAKEAVDQDVCKKVADLYVFLAQHLVQAETTSDVGSIEEIRIVLETEAETWRAVCAQESETSQKSPIRPPRMSAESDHPTTTARSGINFEA